jgi:hypothetical protein
VNGPFDRRSRRHLQIVLAVSTLLSTSPVKAITISADRCASTGGTLSTGSIAVASAAGTSPARNSAPGPGSSAEAVAIPIPSARLTSVSAFRASIIASAERRRHGETEKPGWTPELPAETTVEQYLKSGSRA